MQHGFSMQGRLPPFLVYSASTCPFLKIVPNSFLHTVAMWEIWLSRICIPLTVSKWRFCAAWPGYSLPIAQADLAVVILVTDAKVGVLTILASVLEDSIVIFLKENWGTLTIDGGETRMHKSFHGLEMEFHCVPRVLGWGFFARLANYCISTLAQLFLVNP